MPTTIEKLQSVIGYMNGGMSKRKHAIEVLSVLREPNETILRLMEKHIHDDNTDADAWRSIFDDLINEPPTP